MARLMGVPKIEALKDVVDVNNAAWAGAEINIHVQPDPGEDWPSDLTATCHVDGVEAVVPRAVDALRKWDKDPTGSFYCYAPVGYIADGVRMTLSIHPRDTRGKPTEEIKWQGDFRVSRVGEDFRVEKIGS